MADNKKFEVYTSPLYLAITFYFAEKKHKSKLALSKIKLLSAHLKITGNTPETVLKTINNSSIHDFEDGLEYYAATEAKCQCIVTEDKNDFYFAEIEVMGCEEFFGKYLRKTKGT